MICPYCQREMVDGHIVNRGEAIAWYPGNESKPALTSRWGIGKKGVMVASFGLWNGSFAKSCYCESCKILITKMEE